MISNPPDRARDRLGWDHKEPDASLDDSWSHTSPTRQRVNAAKFTRWRVGLVSGSDRVPVPKQVQRSAYRRIRFGREVFVIS